MASGSNEVRSLLKSVELDGAVIIQKKKLLWLLGWSNDKPGAWKELLDHWAENDNKRETLQGLEAGQYLVLTTGVEAECTHRPVVDWAGEA